VLVAVDLADERSEEDVVEGDVRDEVDDLEDAKVLTDVEEECSLEDKVDTVDGVSVFVECLEVEEDDLDVEMVIDLEGCLMEVENELLVLLEMEPVILTFETLLEDDVVVVWLRGDDV
jgi:hypothetical protein